MSAKYKCDLCKKPMSEHQNSFENNHFLKDDKGVRVVFKIDWGNQKDLDICEPCALDALYQGAKEVHKWTSEQRRRASAAEKRREVEAATEAAKKKKFRIRKKKS